MYSLVKIRRTTQFTTGVNYTKRTSLCCVSTLASNVFIYGFLCVYVCVFVQVTKNASWSYKLLYMQLTVIIYTKPLNVPSAFLIPSSLPSGFKFIMECS